MTNRSISLNESGEETRQDKTRQDKREEQSLTCLRPPVRSPRWGLGSLGPGTAPWLSGFYRTLEGRTAATPSRGSDLEEDGREKGGNEIIEERQIVDTECRGTVVVAL